MPALKISEMEAVAALQLGDIFPVVRMTDPVKNKNMTAEDVFETIPRHVINAGYYGSTATDLLDVSGQISVETDTTLISNSSGGSFDVFLANGTSNQIKTLVMVGDTSNITVKPVQKIGFTQILFTTVGQTVVLKYITGHGWSLLSVNGAIPS